MAALFHSRMSRQRPAGAPVAAVAAVAAVCALAIGCGHSPLERRLDNPTYYLDNTLPFQPKRIWRLWVRWEPYLLDDKKALLVKEFQLVIHDEGERKWLEAEITALGGDKRFLRWLEGELFPLGNWEKREDGRVARFKDLMVVVIVAKAHKEVPRSGHLAIEPVAFPDPLLRAAREGCHELNWDVIRIGDSVGTEVVFESRDPLPGAEKWKFVERDRPTMYWRRWSVGQEKSIAYRTAVFVRSNLSRCPLPPKIHEEFKEITAMPSMGVDW